MWKASCRDPAENGIKSVNRSKSALFRTYNGRHCCVEIHPVIDGLIVKSWIGFYIG